MSKLKNCPFCGGDAEPLKVGTSGSSQLWAIMCGDCGARGERTPDKNWAITTWNNQIGTIKLILKKQKSPLTRQSQTDQLKITSSPSIPQKRTLLEMLCDADRATTVPVFAEVRNYVRVCDLEGGDADVLRSWKSQTNAILLMRS